MKGFRLLALRPLEGTSKKIRKNLKKQVVYKFYQDFIFTDKNDREILKKNENLHLDVADIEFPPVIASDIYSTGGININISAVVGQNGSGKSSLIDFYNLILYYLACYKYDTMPPTSGQKFTEIEYLLRMAEEYLAELPKYQPIKEKYSIDFKLKTEDGKTDVILIIDQLAANIEYRNQFPFQRITEREHQIEFIQHVQRYTIQGAKNYGIPQQKNSHEIDIAYKELNRSIAVKLKKLVSEYQTEKKFNDMLADKFFFQLFYQAEDKVYTIEKNKDGLQPFDSRFFYTILLNYSLHSMNSNNLGNWIFKLFHKNDGYQTPNVINPYRKEGIINVNSELALSTDRLVYNIIDQVRTLPQADILKKYKFKKFILKLKDKHIFPLKDLRVDYRNKEEFLEFLSNIPDTQQAELREATIKDYCLGYLIKKFKKISETYMDHFYESEDFSDLDYPQWTQKVKESQLAKTKKFLLSSESHVARKFNQTYNFLVNFDQLSGELDFLNNWDIYSSIDLKHDNLKKWIELAQNTFSLKDKGTHEVLSHLFPAIFDVDIEFKKDKTAIKLSDLSSGEQQYIFNINTITYHINNLKTIKTVEESKIKNYRHVNIVLDEVELYYHPEYQKNLIHDLRREIKKIDSLGELQNFNILFLTHSPFILSDIPNQNILRLEDGRPSVKEFEPTFGANIHDLLANDFFLKGFMGRFAKNFIKKLIGHIGDISKEHLTSEVYGFYLDRANLIGEPIIRNSVKSILDKRFEKFIVLRKRLEEIEKEKLFIDKELK